MGKKVRFEQRLDALSFELWSKVAQIDELKGQWIGGTQLNSQVLGRLKRSVLITSTGSSTRIEGARLSDEDVEKLMSGLTVQKFTDREKQEAKGYFELLENVFNSWKSLKFSESTIKHFHKELLKYTKKDEEHRGEYKKKENKVPMLDTAGIYIGTLFTYLPPEEIQELVEWTQKAFLEKKIHPLLIIGNFITEFLQIHPFQDGNGRMSRVITNLLLLKAGYLYVPYVSHEKLIEDNKADYYIALRKSQKTFKTSEENILPWLDFFLGILMKQSQMAIELLSQENIEKILSIKQLAIWQYLQTVKEATPKEIVQNTKISRPTVNQVLNKLIHLKKIERLGQGRGIRYRKL